MDILTNKSTKSSNYFSRYNGRAFYYNKKTKKDQLATSSWLKHTNDYSTYIVKEKDTYDSIALEYYNNPTYWWVIALFNDIEDSYMNLMDKFISIKIPQIAAIEFGDLR